MTASTVFSCSLASAIGPQIACADRRCPAQRGWYRIWALALVQRRPKGRMTRLAGKIGIVTAAASGMGRAGALRFAREGAQVAVVDVDAAGVKRVVSEISAAGGTAHGITADLTKDEDSRRIVWGTVSRSKCLDFVWTFARRAILVS